MCRDGSTQRIIEGSEYFCKKLVVTAWKWAETAFTNPIAPTKIKWLPLVSCLTVATRGQWGSGEKRTAVTEGKGIGFRKENRVRKVPREIVRDGDKVKGSPDRTRTEQAREAAKRIDSVVAYRLALISPERIWEPTSVAEKWEFGRRKAEKGVWATEKPGGRQNREDI